MLGAAGRRGAAGGTGPGGASAEASRRGTGAGAGAGRRDGDGTAGRTDGDGRSGGDGRAAGDGPVTGTGRVAGGGVPGAAPVGRAWRAGVAGARCAAVGRGRGGVAGAAEKVGVTRPGGRFGAVCAFGAAENTAAGALVNAGAEPVGVVPVVEVGVVGGWLNGTALGGGDAGGAGCALGAAENTAGCTPPAGAGRGVAGCPEWLNAGALEVPAGGPRGGCAAEAWLKTTAPAGAGDGPVRGGGAGRDGRTGPGRGVVPGPCRAGVCVTLLTTFAPPRMPAAAPRVLIVRMVETICPSSPRPLDRPSGPRMNGFIQLGSLIRTHIIARQIRIPRYPSPLVGIPRIAGPVGVRNTRTVANTTSAWATCMPTHAPNARHQV